LKLRHFASGKLSDQDEYDLARDKGQQPPEGRRHEAVAVQPPAKHVHAKPAPTGDDVAENREVRQAALLHQPARASVED